MENEIITENNRNIIMNVANLLAENKVNLEELIFKQALAEKSNGMLPTTLTEEEQQTLFYARFLYNNKFVDENGKVTQEGIDALYH